MSSVRTLKRLWQSFQGQLFGASRRTKHRRSAGLDWMPPGLEQLESRLVPTDWSGHITSSTTWTNTDVQHIVGNVTVDPGVTLTIQPGTVVQFNRATSLIVDGTLKAQGATGQTIVFTSSQDNSPLGGSNNAGNGDWTCIQLNSDSSNNVLSSTVIAYGGGWGAAGAVVDTGAGLSLTASVLSHSGTAGLRIATASPTVTGDTFQNNSGAAISSDLDSQPTISSVSVNNNNNGTNALVLDSGSLANNETWQPAILYQFSGTVTVPQGFTLNLSAGQIVKLPRGDNNLVVAGTLTAQSSGSPIVFTSYQDDSVGGDTNNNGTSTGGNGDWGSVQFTNGGTTSQLNNVQFYFGGGWSEPAEVFDNGGALTLNNSLVSNSGQAGLRIAQASPTVMGDTFQNNGGAAVTQDLDSQPTISSVNVNNNGNGTNALVLDRGSLLNSETWQPAIVYQFSGTVTVPQGFTLTLSAGQIVKLPRGDNNLIVAGTLNAQSSGSPIVFTSYQDDLVGGDTNNNGTSTGSNGDWGSVQFTNGSTTSQLNNVQFYFGGGWGEPAEVIDNGGGLALNNSVLNNSGGAGLRIAAASPSLAADTFQNNSGPAITMHLDSQPTISSVTAVSNNGVNALVLDSGTLSNNETWNPAIVYQLNGSVTVPQGLSLTLNAGQIVKVGRGDNNLIVNGTLTAQGTGAQPIIFTSYQDDLVGGDTNHNGASTGGNGDWGSVQFGGTSTGSQLNNVQFYFGGGWGEPAEVIDNGGGLVLNNGVVKNSGQAGLRIVQASPSLAGDTFQNNSGAAITSDLDSQPTISNVNVNNNNNGTNALVLDRGSLLNSETWQPAIVYQLSGTVTVPQGFTLTLPAGQIVKMPRGDNSLVVAGTLNAQSSGSPIVFTSYQDDSVGGDTNNNGTSTGSNGDWGSVQFTNGSTTSQLNNVQFYFGGGWGEPAEVIDNGGGLVLNNGVVKNSGQAGLRIVQASPSLTGDTFQNNSGPAVSQDLDSQPTITSVNVNNNNNGTNALVLDSGKLLNSETWQPAIVYQLSGTVTVPQQLTLTLLAGQIIKVARGDNNLIVNGTLTAQGTGAQPIIFTSYQDDSVGGDTNNNGASSGGNSDWGNVQFGTTSTGGNQQHVQVIFGGGWGEPAAVSVNGGGSLSLLAWAVDGSGTTGVAATNGAQVNLVNNLIFSNNGPAILADTNAGVTAINDTIDANPVGVRYGSATVTLTNDIISNSSSDGIDNLQSGGSLTVSSSDVFNPTAGNANYHNVADQTGMNGNINADPKYVDEVNRNYALSSSSPASSAGTDNGAPRADFFDNLRPAGHIDMGAVQGSVPIGPGTTHTITYDQITSFPGSRQIAGDSPFNVLSADGSRAVFETFDASGDQIYTVNSDGSGLTLVDSITNGTVVGQDISADGSVVLEVINHGDQGTQLKIVNADGSNPHDAFVVPVASGVSFRLSPDGRTVFFESVQSFTVGNQPYRPGLYSVAAAGSSTPQLIASDTQVAALVGAAAVSMSSAEGIDLDVSRDGQRLVFAANTGSTDVLLGVSSDGSGLHTIGPVGNPNVIVSEAGISADGSTVFRYDTSNALPAPRLTVYHFDGTNPVTLNVPNNLVPNTTGPEHVQFTKDGSRLLLGTTSLLINTDNSGVLQIGTNVGLDTSNPPNHALVHPGLYHVTMDSTGTRFLYTFKDLTGLFQLAVAHLNPSSLGGDPTISNASISSATLQTDGQSAITVSAAVSASSTPVGVTEAFLLGGVQETNHNTDGPLYDNGTNGDVTATDGTYTNNGVRYSNDGPSGPRTVRVSAETVDGNGLQHVTTVEVNGPTIVNPVTANPVSPFSLTEGSVNNSLNNAVLATFTDPGNPNAAPGDYTATVNWGDGTTDSSGSPAPSGSGITVKVGYADTERTNGFFPSPWRGSANVQFLGPSDPNATIDAGAILITNNNSTPITVNHVTVTIDGELFDIWGSDNVVPAGGSLILTQTNGENFDTSDAPHGGYDGGSLRYPGKYVVGDTVHAPVIQITVNGVQQTYLDSGYVLTTGGSDYGQGTDAQGQHQNESFNWRGVGTTGISNPGGSGVTIVKNPDGSFSVIGSHGYSGDTLANGESEGTVPITVTISHAGASQVVNDSATIIDPPVSVNGAPAFRLTEGSVNNSVNNAVLATFTDPGNPNGNLEDSDDYTATVNWGDGTTDSSGSPAPSGSGITVKVGYADTARANGFFPSPWRGSANVQFLGPSDPNATIDAGAILITNNNSTPITVNHVTVTIDGELFDIWGSDNVVPVGGSLILTQTNGFNFDTSDAPHGGYDGGSLPYPGKYVVGDTVHAPVIQITVNGMQQTYLDSGYVLTTGGSDYGQGTDAQGNHQNESFNWRPVGTTGIGNPGGSGVTIVKNPDGSFSVIGSHGYSGDTLANGLSEGPVPITVTISHDATLPQVVNDSATIIDPPVSVNGAPALPSLFQGSALSNELLATFADPGDPGGTLEDADDYSATVNWGDGGTDSTASANLVIVNNHDGTFSVKGSHTYTATGQMAITVTINHDATQAQTVNDPITVQPVPVQFSASSYSVHETAPAGLVTITVTRTGSSSGGATVHYATSDGTAHAGTDYTAASGDLTFNPGDSSETFPVRILNDQDVVPVETFNVTLSTSDSRVTLGTPSTAVVNIIHDAPTVMGITPSVGPASGGTTVTIAGTGFSSATKVAFAGVPATSFTINSDGQITAVSPPGTPGLADVTVTTPIGTSATSGADQFTYLAPLTLAALPDATANTPYSAPIGVTGGFGPYTYSVTAGSLPPGLSLISGAVTGTPTTTGSYPFTITVTDTSIVGLTGSRAYTLKVNASSSLTLSPATLLPGAAGSSYGPIPFSATGGSGSYSFKATGLPATLKLSKTGILSGTPAAPGTISFTVTATDTSNSSLTGKRTYSLTVNPALVISPATLKAATVGSLYSTPLTVKGGSGTGYTWTASSGFPSWLSLSSTGLLSGTPTSATGSPLTIKVMVQDSNGSAASKSYTLTINKVIPTLSTIPGPAVVIGSGDLMTDSATVTGFNLTGNLHFTLLTPAGASVDTESVKVNGSGTYSTPNGYSPQLTDPTGTYHWLVSYGDDPINQGVSSNLKDEPETVVGRGVTVIGTTLYLVGGNSNDQIQIIPIGSSSTGSTGIQVAATLNGVFSMNTYRQAFSSIVIDSFGGDDTIQEARSLTISTTVNAGDGNNQVQVGNGNNVVVTGSGFDHIQAGDGNNLIVAGLGQHFVAAGNGRNILIDGSVQLNQSGDSLRKVLDDWSRQAVTPDAIRARLKVTYNSSNNNTLAAGNGPDWFWDNFAGDLTNRKGTDLHN